MAAFDLQEQEQIESLKAFWQRWGVWITGVVIGVSLGFVGYKGWHMWQDHQAAKASALYVPVEQAAEASDLARLKTAAEPLKAAYPGSAYAARGAMLAARAAFDSGDLKAAAEQLAWVTNNSKETALVAVARMRLASILLEQKQADAALAELAKPHAAEFESQFLELKGDALLAKNDTKAAAQAWRDALAKLAPDAPQQALLQMKLDALGA